MRAYALLRDALERSGRVAIAQVALRQRESLATLRCRDGVLVLETLLWPDEVRASDFSFLDDDIEVRSQELRMATSLIDSMTVDFDPDEYHDRYREALQELVEAKVEGRDVLQPETGEVVSAPTSLADALRASLAAARGDGGDADEAPAKGEDSAAETGSCRISGIVARQVEPGRGEDDKEPADATDERGCGARSGLRPEPAAPRRTRRRAS